MAGRRDNVPCLRITAKFSEAPPFFIMNAVVRDGLGPTITVLARTTWFHYWEAVHAVFTPCPVRTCSIFTSPFVLVMFFFLPRASAQRDAFGGLEWGIRNGRHARDSHSGDAHPSRQPWGTNLWCEISFAISNPVALFSFSAAWQQWQPGISICKITPSPAQQLWF